MSDFGVLLRGWLTHLDLSANALGRRLGHKDGRAVRKWFHAPRGPYMQTQQKVAEALGVTLGEFLAGPPAATRRGGGLDAAEAARRMGESADDASQRPPATGEQSA